jgi:hypothetical protein
MSWVLNENGVRSRSSYSTWLRSRARYLVAKGEGGRRATCLVARWPRFLRLVGV